MSKRRLIEVPRQVYESLLQMISAPTDDWAHWHNLDRNDLRSESNPLMGHVLERSWNIIFDCIDPLAAQHCEACDRELECLLTACQCSDKDGQGIS